MNTKTIVRQQLDKRLAALKLLVAVERPALGWLRAIRDALSMSGSQLAKRMNLSKQRISVLEKAEMNGSATLNSMRQAAEALDCVFVYAVVPRSTLEDTVTEKARKLAEKQQEYASHSMMLEDQLPSSAERQAALDTAVAELVRDMPKNLWD